MSDGGGEATRLIVVRHGQTAWNAQSRIQGQHDIPLDDTGLWQARRLADALAHEAIDVIYSSDLQRALATAAPLAAAAGLPVRHEAGLRERHFGQFEGSTYDEVAQRWPDASQRLRQREEAYGPPGGETLRDFYERSVAAALALAARHPGRTVVLVSHGGVLDCLHRAALRLPLQAPRTWQVPNAAINRLLHTPDGFSMVGWNDAAHLEAA